MATGLPLEEIVAELGRLEALLRAATGAVEVPNVGAAIDALQVAQSVLHEINAIAARQPSASLDAAARLAE
jgi:hypothetical protein